MFLSLTSVKNNLFVIPVSIFELKLIIFQFRISFWIQNWLSIWVSFNINKNTIKNHCMTTRNVCLSDWNIGINLMWLKTLEGVTWSYFLIFFQNSSASSIYNHCIIKYIRTMVYPTTTIVTWMKRIEICLIVDFEVWRWQIVFHKLAEIK